MRRTVYLYYSFIEVIIFCIFYVAVNLLSSLSSNSNY